MIGAIFRALWFVVKFYFSFLAVLALLFIAVIFLFKFPGELLIFAVGGLIVFAFIRLSGVPL